MIPPSARGRAASRTSAPGRRAGRGSVRPRPRGSAPRGRRRSRCVRSIVQGRGSYHHPAMADRRRVRGIRDRAPQGVRAARAAPAPRAGGRAGPHASCIKRTTAIETLATRACASASPPGPRRAMLPSTRSRTRSAGAAWRRRRRCGSRRSSRDRRRRPVWMEDAPLEEGRDYLCALPGVGRKTAACVLLFSYGLPEMPVDTHVYRVGTRLGLWPRARSSSGSRRDAAAGGRPGGGVRAARAADPARPPDLRGAQPGLPGVPAEAHVPEGRRGWRLLAARMSESTSAGSPSWR